MKMLFELPGSPIEGRRYLNPYAVDFISSGPGMTSSSIRLRCGTALTCSQLSPSDLAAKLRPWLGDGLLVLRSGIVNVVSVDAILPNGSSTILKLRGGSNGYVDPSEIPALDAAMAQLLLRGVQLAA